MQKRRFLVITMPVPGHVAPTAPVVRALTERGHQVVWYGSRFYKDAIEATGAEFAPLHKMPDFGDGDFERHFPNREKYKGLARLREDMKRGFIDTIPGMEHDVRAILDRYPADVLLTDDTIVLGRILCDQGVLPWAALSISVLGFPGRDIAPFGLGLSPAYTPLGRLRNRALRVFADSVVFGSVHRHFKKKALENHWPQFPFGFHVSPYLHMQPCSPEFEYHRTDLPPQVHFIGPLLSPPPKTFVRPSWWDKVENAWRPIVLVTQGTIANRVPQLIQPTLDALASENVFVVATTGGKTAAELGLRVPENAVVEPFVPYANLMPHVSVTVTNGGYGGVMISLAHGVPLVGAGITEDKTEVNARIAHAGVGINLRTEKPTAEMVREAVRKVLNEEIYRHNARFMQASLARYTATQTAANLLEELAKTRQPVTAPAPEPDFQEKTVLYTPYR